MNTELLKYEVSNMNASLFQAIRMYYKVFLEGFLSAGHS